MLLHSRHIESRSALCDVCATDIHGMSSANLALFGGGGEEGGIDLHCRSQQTSTMEECCISHRQGHSAEVHGSLCNHIEIPVVKLEDLRDVERAGKISIVVAYRRARVQICSLWYTCTSAVDSLPRCTGDRKTKLLAVITQVRKGKRGDVDG